MKYKIRLTLEGLNERRCWQISENVKEMII